MLNEGPNFFSVVLCQYDSRWRGWFLLGFVEKLASGERSEGRGGRGIRGMR